MEGRDPRRPPCHVAPTPPPETPCNRPRDKFKRESMKCRIPAAPPEFADCFRTQRRIHDRFHIHSCFAPSKREKLEHPEMQDKNHADRADPAGEEWLMGEVSDTE